MTTQHTPAPAETPAELVHALRREVELQAKGRDDLAPFVAWLRTCLDVLAERLTLTHRTGASPTKAHQNRHTVN